MQQAVSTYFELDSDSKVSAKQISMAVVCRGSLRSCVDFSLSDLLAENDSEQALGVAMDFLAVAFAELDLPAKVEFVADLCEGYAEVVGKCMAGISVAKSGSLKQIAHLFKKKVLFRSP